MKREDLYNMVKERIRDYEAHLTVLKSRGGTVQTYDERVLSSRLRARMHEAIIAYLEGELGTDRKL